MKKFLLFVNFLLVSCAPKEPQRQNTNPISHKTLSNSDALFLKNLKDHPQWKNIF